TTVIRTEVKNKDNMLKIGMFANIKIYTAENQVCVVIPKDAVIDHEDKKIVIIKDKEGFKRREVKVGQTCDNQIAILSGINEGDEIVTRGNFQIFSEMIKKKGIGVDIH
ncbi:efflux RND transporter periplasmic adaptor subunit, partial [candidate division KSB1 bacterium]